MADDLSTRGIERQRRRMTSDLGEPAAKADGPLSEADEQWLRDHPDLQSTPVRRLLATLDQARAARGGEGLREALDWLIRSAEGSCSNPRCPSEHEGDAPDCLDYHIEQARFALTVSPTTEPGLDE